MNSSAFDVISVGGCVIDAFLTIHDANVHCHLNEKECELCIQYGGKIPVDDCQFLLGGNGANVSVGLSRCGFKSGILSEIGDDEFFGKIITTLFQEQVDTTHLIKTSDAPSTFSVIINFKKERTIFSRHIKRTHLFDFSGITSSWIYLTSLGEEWEKVYTDTLEFVVKNNAKLAFNPGSHQLEKDVEGLKNILEKTDMLFVNKEEAIKIANSKLQIANGDMKELLSSVQKLGPKVVVITDGLQGSYALNKEGKVFYCPLFDTPVIERTGAGDGYASGFLAAIMQGSSVEDAMRWGTLNAASVIGKIGAQPGLLTKKEIEKKLSENLEFKAQRM